MHKNIPPPLYPTRTGRSARERVALRTRELAVLAGRHPPNVSQADYEQAKQDVTGESLPYRQDVILNAGA